ncbi:MAG: right-handed parallel beta-helix repeat-containing protein [Gemmatimonadota bacterium]
MTRLLVTLALASLFCGVALATTIHVPSEQPTIQAGIDAASAGDTVLVACGTYYEHDIEMKSGVYLTSETGQADCVKVDAKQQGRVFYCDHVDSLASVVGFTITGGFATGPYPGNCGGGMSCFYSSPTLTDCTFEGNQAYRGGAMVCDSSSPTLTGCTFSGNQANANGGGMCWVFSCPTLTDCTFSGNVTTGPFGTGGAISSSFFDPTSTAATLTACTFSGNHAGYEGGGMACRSSCPTLTACVFSKNHAGYDGGGMICGSSYPTLTACTFWRNEAGSAGGGMACSSSAPTLMGCTFSGNQADYRGGGVCCSYSSSPDFTNCIIAFSQRGEAVCCGEGAASTPTLSCCDLYGNVGGDWVGCIADQNGANDNFSEDPLFCGEDNPDEPLTLHSDSPCAGENNPACGLVGAWGVGCESPVEMTSWGAIKAMFR